MKAIIQLVRSEMPLVKALERPPRVVSIGFLTWPGEQLDAALSAFMAERQRVSFMDDDALLDSFYDWAAERNLFRMDPSR